MAAGTLVSSGSSGSMPTGSGSERLCRASIHNLNADTQEILSGVAGHIYTIISIICSSQVSASQTISIKVNDGSNDIVILSGETLPIDGTFIFSDRFVMEEDDDLDVYNSGTNADWYVSYIDQNWV